MTNNLAPAVRFPGSTDDWEQRKLLDMSERICVGFVGTCEQYYTDSTGIPMYRTGNLNGLYLNKDDLKYVTQEFHNKNMKSQLKRGDILIARHGDSGKAVIYNYSDEANCLNIVIIRPNSNECDYRFLAQCINSPMPSKQIKGLSAGSTQSVINTKEIEKLAVSVPRNVEEQKVLANFFFNLDNVIALHQRELDNLRATKQGFLEKMFPKEGEMVPEIRFPGFTGNWEQHKLNDLALFNPKSNLPEEFEYVDLESVIGTTMVSHRTETKESAPSRAQRLAVKGDVFYQTVRPYQKNNYLFDLPYDNYVFSTGYAQLRPYGDSYFLLSRLQEERFVLNVLDRCTGTSYPAINSSDLAQIEIHVPLQYEEQVKIGKFFNQLDDTVNLHQKELEKLKQTKQAFLQKMFI